MAMEKITVNLYWIRHAFSCANILQQKGFVANLARPVITIDPVLTTIGVEQATELNKYLVSGEIANKFDAVLCSNMRRAMETAMYAFNEVNPAIFVVPYISEARNVVASGLNVDKENAPQTAEELEKYYTDIKKDFKIEVDFTILKELDPSGKLKPDYKNFIANVLPTILNNLSNKKSYDIAIVSHSHFIKQHFTALYPKMDPVKNTEMWKEQLELNMIRKIKNYKHNRLDECANTKGVCKVYDGALAKVDSNTIDARCIEKQNSKLYTMAMKQKGGDYYDKYREYKLKYLQLKQKHGLL